MDYKEAVDWLEGNRSMTNLIPQDPFETWQVRIAEADAAMTVQAYWIVKARTELANLEKLAEAFGIMTTASIQSHNGHWDSEGNAGRTCPACIRTRELRDSARKLWAEGVGEEET